MTPRPAQESADPGAAPRSADGSQRGVREPAGAVLLLVLVAVLFQLLTPVPWDADTAYHVAVGRLIRQHGLLTSFPWTPFSWLADRYADKELLFHLLLVPLAGLPWIAAAKIAGVVAGATALCTIYLVLRTERVAAPSLWTLLPLAASGAFALRFACVRPHLLSIALAVLVTWAAARRRLPALAVAAALYPLAYVGWPVTVVLVAGVEAVLLLSGGRPTWRTAAVALGGNALGVALHPNARNLLHFTWLQDVQILVDTAWRQRAGFDLGQEFQPFSPGDLARHVLPLAALAVAAAALAWRPRRRDPLPLVFALAALGFLALTTRTARFVEYLAPFAAVAAALAAARQGLRRSWASATLGGAFLYTAALGSAPILALATRGDDVPPRFAEFLQASIPEGSQVFTCDWGLTGELMIALPERRFMVALDPVLFYRKDPDLYRRWYRLTHEGAPDAAEQLRRDFGARYAICLTSQQWVPLLVGLDRDPTVRLLFRNRVWSVYALEKGGAGAPAPAAP